ncbi:MAG: CDP-alcohol phosphatidyltransferase family protein [Candidatus Hodarchaeales archaeon]
MNKYLLIALGFTILNALCGVMGIIFILNSELFLVYPFAPLQFLVIGAIFDFLDGKIAKMSSVESRLGVFSDSISDIISFAILPGILLLNAPLLFNEYEYLRVIFSILISGFYTLSGWARLVRFTFHPTKKYFEGFPSPAAGLLIGSSAILARFPDMNWFFWPNGLLLSLFAVASGILMIQTIPYPTPKRQMPIDTILIGVAGMVVILFVIIPSILSLTMILFISLLYTILGPWYLQLTERRTQQ